MSTGFTRFCFDCRAFIRARDSDIYYYAGEARFAPSESIGIFAFHEEKETTTGTGQAMNRPVNCRAAARIRVLHSFVPTHPTAADFE
jgi:hypothetical protein